MKKCLKNFVFYDGAEVRAHETFLCFSVNKLPFQGITLRTLRRR